MSVSTNEPMQIKKVCPSLIMSAVPQTDQGGIYQGETQSIWIRTREPLGKEQRQRFEEMGIRLSRSNPAYSQGSSFVYTADLQHGAQLKAFLALPVVLQVRGSERLTPLNERTAARDALDELRSTSGASHAFTEYLVSAGVSQRAQRVILSAVENLVAPGEVEQEDDSPYKGCFASVIHQAVTRTKVPGKGEKEWITSTRGLAEALREIVEGQLATDSHPTSQALARDTRDLSEQLDSIATPRRVL